MGISLFDSSIRHGTSSGVVFRHRNSSASIPSPSLGATPITDARHTAGVIPAQYISERASAYVGYLAFSYRGNGTIYLRLSPSSSGNGSGRGPDFNSILLNNLGIAIKVDKGGGPKGTTGGSTEFPDGAEVKFDINNDKDFDSDSSEPYEWEVANNNLDTYLLSDGYLIGALRSGGCTVVFVDRNNPNIDWENLQLQTDQIISSVGRSTTRSKVSLTQLETNVNIIGSGRSDTRSEVILSQEETSVNVLSGGRSDTRSSVELQQNIPSENIGNISSGDILDTPGLYFWIVPDGVRSITVELVGGGGGGGGFLGGLAEDGDPGTETKFEDLVALPGLGGKRSISSNTSPGGAAGAPDNLASESVGGESGAAGSTGPSTGGRSGSRNVEGLKGYGDGGDGVRHPSFPQFSGGGGGGGAYERWNNLAVTPGDSIPFTIGKGGRGGNNGSPSLGYESEAGRSGALRITWDTLVPTIHEISADGRTNTRSQVVITQRDTTGEDVSASHESQHGIRGAGNTILDVPDIRNINITHESNHDIRGSGELFFEIPISVSHESRHGIIGSGNVLLKIPVLIDHESEHDVRSTGNISVRLPRAVNVSVFNRSVHDIRGSGRLAFEFPVAADVGVSHEIYYDIRGDGNIRVSGLQYPFEQFRAHWLLKFIDIDPSSRSETDILRVWSGDGVLSYNDEDYFGAGSFMQLSQAETQIDQPNTRLTAVLASGGDDIKRLFVNDESIYTVEITWIASRDDGISYLPTGRRFRGRTNNPIYSNQQYIIEIEPVLSDIFRQQPRYWSDEDQRNIDSTDLGFSFASYLIDGTKRQRWPG